MSKVTPVWGRGRGGQSLHSQRGATRTDWRGRTPLIPTRSHRDDRPTHLRGPAPPHPRHCSWHRSAVTAPREGCTAVARRGGWRPVGDGHGRHGGGHSHAGRTSLYSRRVGPLPSGASRGHRRPGSPRVEREGGGGTPIAPLRGRHGRRCAQSGCLAGAAAMPAPPAVPRGGRGGGKTGKRGVVAAEREPRARPRGAHPRWHRTAVRFRSGTRAAHVSSCQSGQWDWHAMKTCIGGVT